MTHTPYIQSAEQSPGLMVLRPDERKVFIEELKAMEQDELIDYLVDIIPTCEVREWRIAYLEMQIEAMKEGKDK